MCRIAQWNHTFADKHRVPPPGYCPGQKVWLSTRDLPLQVDSRKLAPTFIGRYEIDKISNPRCPAETSPFPRSSHNPRLSSEAIRHQSTPRCYRTYTEFPHKSGTMTVPSRLPQKPPGGALWGRREGTVMVPLSAFILAVVFCSVSGVAVLFYLISGLEVVQLCGAD